MRVAACICGEIRVLESPHMQRVLWSRFQLISPDYFFVVSRYWTSQQRWVNETSIRQIFSPILFLETNTSIDVRFETCFAHVVHHEIRAQKPYEWVLKTRPDVYLHCRLQSFHTFDVAAAWDYLVIVRRVYAMHLFASYACGYHPAICNVCKIRRVFANTTFRPIFQSVDLARSCQLHKAELRKHRCTNVSYAYAQMTNDTCPMPYEIPSRMSLWASLSQCSRQMLIK